MRRRSLRAEVPAAVAENSTAVMTVTASDADAGATRTTRSPGGRCSPVHHRCLDGALAFIAAPNYEGAADAGSNNVYDVIVQVSDGSLTATQAIAVTVTNVNEAPSITLPAAQNTTEDKLFSSRPPEATPSRLPISMRVQARSSSRSLPPTAPLRSAPRRDSPSRAVMDRRMP